MKKFWLLLFCVLMGSALYGQHLPDVFGENHFQRDRTFYYLSNRLDDLFHKEHIDSKKPWQAALFLGTQLRPTEETLHALKEQIRSGNLQRATVLSFAVQGTDAAGTAYLYTLYSNEGKAEMRSRSFSPDTPLAVLLDALFMPLQVSPDLYTALIINGRGDGISIRYSKGYVLLLSDLYRPLAARHLRIDVLDLQACRMGSAFAVKQMLQNGHIHYAIVSSNLRRGSRETMYYRLLNHFDKNPREAALAAHREFAEIIDFSSDKSTHNSIVLDLAILQEPFRKWTLTSPSVLLESGWHSFRDFLLGQSTSSANNLARALDEAVLDQWCYSVQTHQLYQKNIPADNDCIDGINVNREMIPAFLP